MRQFLTCSSGRGVVLRKTPVSPASFSNLNAIWCGFTAPREKDTEPLTCLTHTGCPSVSPSYRGTLESRRSSWGIPLSCLPIDTEICWSPPGHWRQSGRLAGGTCALWASSGSTLGGTEHQCPWRWSSARPRDNPGSAQAGTLPTRQ